MFKRLCIPFLKLVRIIRVAILFLYDGICFYRNVGFYSRCGRDVLESKIIMGYHVLEKGLTMPEMRLNFGHSAILTLLGQIDEYVHMYGYGSSQVNHAIACVQEYKNIHAAANVNMENEFWKRVCCFCDEYSAIEPSSQTKATYEEFYAKVENSFPKFAESRHTVRWFDDEEVPVTEIKKAVELAISAPSACNRQYVKVICVGNPEIRAELLKNQNGNRGFGSKANKILVVTANLSGLRWLEERNDPYTNAGIFIMNLCYSLHYYKIAHCILNWSVRPRIDSRVHRLLHIGQGERIAAIIVCGHAPTRFMVASSPRRNISEVYTELL